MAPRSASLRRPLTRASRGQCVVHARPFLQQEPSAGAGGHSTRPLQQQPNDAIASSESNGTISALPKYPPCAVLSAPLPSN
jgi:hypothetical protein